MDLRRARNCLLVLLLRQRTHNAALHCGLSPLPQSEMRMSRIAYAALTLLLQSSHAPNDDALRNEAR